MKKSLLCVVILIVVLAIVATSGFAGGATGKAAEKVTLRFMTQPGHNAAGFEAQLEAYEQINPAQHDRGESLSVDVQ